MSGVLSVVATPIGNLEDITLRALRVLKEADVVYAEDTRVVAKLLAHYDISKKVLRLDAATEGKKAAEVIERLERGGRVVLVSDAGTPGISDPGARLVAAIRQRMNSAGSGDFFPRETREGGERENFFSTRTIGGSEKKFSRSPQQSDNVPAPPSNDFRIEAIPGPSSVTATLSIAGIPADQFLFLGFLPHKKGRQTALTRIAVSDVPVVLFESPHRIGKLLAELGSRGMTRVAIARELTKLHEEFFAGTPEEVAAHLEKEKAERGEFVVIIEPREE